MNRLNPESQLLQRWEYVKSEKHETIADIEVKLRNLCDNNICPWWKAGGDCASCPLGGAGKNCIFANIADRIEAAQKREVGNGAALATKKKALEVLRESQMWRKGEGKYRIQWNDLLYHEPVPYPYSPEEVDAALDVAIEILKKEVEK